ncbi:MAG: rhodanese-like domain-containing protein [Verrucomicrobiae bacterium]|nr:rhodanese-like domain-containing protein [Verrucomicrobiae bacterium]
MISVQWLVVLGVLVVAGVLWALKRADTVGDEAAREYLRQGAKVIDVRSVEEYRERHVPGAVNIPLDELEQRVRKEAPDKSAVLLLHCLSGGRSAVGVRVLKRMGYAKVFNLGSLARAEKIAAKNEK